MMLDIVIVNWNSGKLLSDCIDSIESGNMNHVGKVIVVDNNSKDNSRNHNNQSNKVILVKILTIMVSQNLAILEQSFV